MSNISRRQLAKTTVRLLQQQPAQRDKIVQGVAAYLIEHKQAGQLHLLMHDIARELQQTQQHVFATVHSAFALTTEARQELSSFLQTKTNAKTVELEEHTAADLLAGMVVQTADYQLDTSAKRKLGRLAHVNSKGQ